RTLCRLPDGGGRHLTANVPRDFAADRGITAAAATSASVRCPMVMRSRATDRRRASKCQGKWPAQTLDEGSARSRCRQPSAPRAVLQEGRKNANIHVRSAVIRGIPAQDAHGRVSRLGTGFERAAGRAEARAAELDKRLLVYQPLD